jgi:site-specific DNA-methyltransferase (adenine-specific)
MERAYKEGLIHQSKPGAVPAYKRYLDEMQGQPVTDDWDDIEHLHGVTRAGGESLGYPKQKPLALLERIIQASSNEGDMVLDPFCGCGHHHSRGRKAAPPVGRDRHHPTCHIVDRDTASQRLPRHCV